MIADHLPLTWQVRCKQTTKKVPGSLVESALVRFTVAVCCGTVGEPTKDRQ